MSQKRGFSAFGMSIQEKQDRRRRPQMERLSFALTHSFCSWLLAQRRQLAHLFSDRGNSVCPGNILTRSSPRTST